MEVAIIGGGITGLSCAYYLSKNKDCRVTLFEKEFSLGGLSGSFKPSSWQWPLEKYYHHIFSSDYDVLLLASMIGIRKKLLFKKPKTSILLDNHLCQLDSPFSLFALPKLAFLDKIRLGITTAFLKINPFWRYLENISAAKFITKTMGKNTYRLIWQPLLKSKFGKHSEKIPASWFWIRIKKRSSRLGYFEGGFETLIAKLTEELCKQGQSVFPGKPITKIKKEGDKFFLFSQETKFNKNFDKVVVAASPGTLLKLTPDLSEEEKKQFKDLESFGSLCLILELKEPFFKDNTYWLNINDENYPFVAVVEHTNFIDKKYYGGEHLVYVGGYYPQNHRYFRMKKEEILKEFLPYLKKINPEYDFKPLTVLARHSFSEGGNFELFTNLYTQPIPSLNYSKNLLPSIKTSVPGLYWGSLHHVYPYDRGINYAIKLGKKIAYEILFF